LDNYDFWNSFLWAIVRGGRSKIPKTVNFACRSEGYDSRDETVESKFFRALEVASGNDFVGNPGPLPLSVSLHQFCQSLLLIARPFRLLQKGIQRAFPSLAALPLRSPVSDERRDGVPSGEAVFVDAREQTVVLRFAPAIWFGVPFGGGRFREGVGSYRKDIVDSLDGGDFVSRKAFDLLG
jgi:hypothetical protein